VIKNITATHFIIQEFVPKSVYRGRGQKAWQLIDNRIIENADALRKALNIPLTINNWHDDGSRTQSGLRLPGQSYHKPYSQHSFGRAVDIIGDFDADEVRELIKVGEILLPHIVCFETGVSWIHMDVRSTAQPSHYFFDP